MKKWLKRHIGKILTIIAVGFSVLFLVDIAQADSEIMKVLYALCVGVWLFFAIVFSGILKRIYDWWD